MASSSSSSDADTYNSNEDLEGKFQPPKLIPLIRSQSTLQQKKVRLSQLIDVCTINERESTIRPDKQFYF
jgi:hypothetical protein